MLEERLEQALRLAIDPPGGLNTAALRDLIRDDENTQWDIATTAEYLGISAHTLRYYERAGLVKVGRDASGYRLYDAAAVRRLVFITRMRVSGMSSDQYDIDSVDNQRRRDLGLQVLSRIDGDAGQSVIESLSTSNPALGHHIAAFAFGDIYDRPGLDARSRQLVTIGVLTALGGCEPQLKVHVGAALNVGISEEEIQEAILHASVYCGFPRALNATFAAQEAIDSRRNYDR